MNKKRDIFISLFILLEENHLSIRSEMNKKNFNIILQKKISHKFDDDNDLVGKIKFEKTNFSRVKICGINGDLVINNRFLKNLKYQKYKISQYLLFLKQNFMKVRKIIKIFTNTIIYLESYSFSDLKFKQELIEEFMYIHFFKLLSSPPEIFILFQNLVANLSTLEKRVERKIFFYSPYKYL